MEMMKREINPLIKPLASHKQNPVYVKLVLLFLLFGVVIFLFSSRSIDYSTPSLQTLTSLAFRSSVNGSEPNDEAALSSTSIESHKDEQTKEKCDLFEGNWVTNPSGATYNNNTCNTIDGHQNCMANGRPDTGYLYWKWKPKGCEVPKFNPLRFLEFMRNKTFGLIGDSISRNHLQSILCMLSQVVEVKEIYHDADYTVNTWMIPSYNVTITRIFSPFLVKSVMTFQDKNVDIQVHLDKLDENWTKHYQSFNYLMISGGQWFLKTTTYYENNAATGCHNCPPGNNNLTEIGYDVAYRKALNLVYNFITSSTHKPEQILLRTITTSHFEGGDWSGGGSCRRKVPFEANEVSVSGAEKVLYEIQFQEFDKASESSRNESMMRLFDITKLSLLRPDGHPGGYREQQVLAKDKNAPSDCLHWCLPGPIDSWNDLLLETLMS